MNKPGNNSQELQSIDKSMLAIQTKMIHWRPQQAQREYQEEAGGEEGDADVMRRMKRMRIQAGCCVSGTTGKMPPYRN
ncbi:hypothetical protein SKAU_G00129440 [Synaphobranchus kaupii]|uniref:Uncharacterized protein n=1 Tax=Synaphobranchus kaupii TaxID=118154 RepID=A0A9Q1J372_SYNKA|nr:hypothetical protein SKAU_G00129440 [Synaphobranchus kaupii]